MDKTSEFVEAMRGLISKEFVHSYAEDLPLSKYPMIRIVVGGDINIANLFIFYLSDHHISCTNYGIANDQYFDIANPSFDPEDLIKWMKNKIDF